MVAAMAQHKIVCFLSNIMVKNIVDVLLLLMAKVYIVQQKLMQKEIWLRINGPDVMHIVPKILVIILQLHGNMYLILKILQ